HSVLSLPELKSFDPPPSPPLMGCIAIEQRRVKLRTAAGPEQLHPHISAGSVFAAAWACGLPHGPGQGSRMGSRAEGGRAVPGTTQAGPSSDHPDVSLMESEETSEGGATPPGASSVTGEVWNSSAAEGEHHATHTAAKMSTSPSNSAKRAELSTPKDCLAAAGKAAEMLGRPSNAMQKVPAGLEQGRGDTEPQKGLSELEGEMLLEEGGLDYSLKRRQLELVGLESNQDSSSHSRVQDEPAPGSPILLAVNLSTEFPLCQAELGFHGSDPQAQQTKPPLADAISSQRETPKCFLVCKTVSEGHYKAEPFLDNISKDSLQEVDAGAEQEQRTKKLAPALDEQPTSEGAVEDTAKPYTSEAVQESLRAPQGLEENTESSTSHQLSSTLTHDSQMSSLQAEGNTSAGETGNISMVKDQGMVPKENSSVSKCLHLEDDHRKTEGRPAPSAESAFQGKSTAKRTEEVNASRHKEPAWEEAVSELQQEEEEEECKEQNLPEEGRPLELKDQKNKEQNEQEQLQREELRLGEELKLEALSSAFGSEIPSVPRHNVDVCGLEYASLSEQTGSAFPPGEPLAVDQHPGEDVLLKAHVTEAGSECQPPAVGPLSSNNVNPAGEALHLCHVSDQAEDLEDSGSFSIGGQDIGETHLDDKTRLSRENEHSDGHGKAVQRFDIRDASFCGGVTAPFSAENPEALVPAYPSSCTSNLEPPDPIDVHPITGKAELWAFIPTSPSELTSAVSECVPEQEGARIASVTPEHRPGTSLKELPESAGKPPNQAAPARGWDTTPAETAVVRTDAGEAKTSHELLTSEEGFLDDLSYQPLAPGPHSGRPLSCEVDDGKLGAVHPAPGHPLQTAPSASDSNSMASASDGESLAERDGLVPLSPPSPPTTRTTCQDEELRWEQPTGSFSVDTKNIQALLAVTEKTEGERRVRQRLEGEHQPKGEMAKHAPLEKSSSWPDKKNIGVAVQEPAANQENPIKSRVKSKDWHRQGLKRMSVPPDILQQVPSVPSEEEAHKAHREPPVSSETVIMREKKPADTTENFKRRHSKLINSSRLLYQEYSDVALNKAIQSQKRADYPEDIESSFPSSPRLRRKVLPPQDSYLQRLSVSSNASLWQDIPMIRGSRILLNMSREEQRLQEAKFELIMSEASYLRSLNVAVDHFQRSAELQAMLTNQERQWLFSRLSDVRDVSASFLFDLEEKFEEDMFTFHVCDVALKHAPDFRRVYLPYVTNQTYQEQTFQRLLNGNAGFQQVLERLESDPNILKRTRPGSEEEVQATQAYDALEKLIKDCNENVQRMKSTEELIYLSQKIEFECKIFPLISQSRRLVKCGELTALDFNNLSPKWKVTTRPIYLHLFNDCLLLSRPKEGGRFVVFDHAAFSYVRGEKCEMKLHGANKNLFRLFLLQNNQGKRVEFLFRTETHSEKLRWISALAPPRGEPDLLECPDAPQVQCIKAYKARENDELALEKADIVMVMQNSNDGWIEGVKLSDRERGWFPSEHVENISSKHVRQKNLKEEQRVKNAKQQVFCKK
ncbi:hypothetical protein IHE44_0011981, partial [Lamprotornis superbus]